MRNDDSDWPPEDEDDELDADAEATPGERLLYALGQVEHLQRAGRLPRQAALAVEDIARIAGVAAKLEFVTRDGHGQHCHFPDEVLVIGSGRPVTRRLFNVWDWADYQEWKECMDELEELDDGDELA
ncbi:MAG: hypothetical protein ABSG64_04555 [Solirubrobacteraceae bacterium]|jgi:hypothetical protein